MLDQILGGNDYKKYINALLIILSLFLLVKTINELRISGTIGRDLDLTSTISVSGKGEVTAVPDIATFNFSVREENLEVSEAQEVVSEKVSKILDALEDLDIEEKDIKTLSYNVYPRYEFRRQEIVCVTFPCPQPPGERVLTGYEVNETISVKLRDIDKAGEVLSALGSLEIDNLNGPNFEIEDIDELQREARKEAIKEARRKAEDLADDLGVKLLRVVSFSDGRSLGRGFDDFAVLESVSSDGKGGAFAPEIPAGENKVFSNVNIVYEIK